jgi:hypothetical protein
VGTASVPKGAFAGLGMAQGFFAIERHLTRVTDELHISPLHWKLERNIAKQNSAAVKLPIGITVKKPLAIRTIIDTVNARSDFGRKWAAYDLLRRRENPTPVSPISIEDKVLPLRGIGLAIAYQGAGLLYHTGDDPLPHVTAVIEDGEMTIKCAASKEIGLNSALWKKRAFDAARSVKSVRYDDSGNDWGDDPAILSRDIACITGLVEQAVQGVTAPENRCEARYQSEDVQNWTGKICDQKAFANPSLCAAVIEVEIDKVEYKPLIRGIRLCVEGGKIPAVSAADARNILTVSSIAALAWAQGKHEVPNIKDVPNIEIDFISPNNEPGTENEQVTGDGYSTGLEELAFSTLPAAYAAAVSQALNISFDRLPIRPLEIWHALNPKAEDEVLGGEE